jgi:hypothetical protein
VAVALFLLYLGQILLVEQGKISKQRLRATTARTKTPVLAIILEYQL